MEEVERIYHGIAARHGLSGARIEYLGEESSCCLRWRLEDSINRQIEAMSFEDKFDIGISAWKDTEISGGRLREWQFDRVGSVSQNNRLADICDEAFLKVSGWEVSDLIRKHVYPGV